MLKLRTLVILTLFVFISAKFTYCSAIKLPINGTTSGRFFHRIHDILLQVWRSLSRELPSSVKWDSKNINHTSLPFNPEGKMTPVMTINAPQVTNTIGLMLARYWPTSALPNQPRANIGPIVYVLLGSNIFREFSHLYCSHLQVQIIVNRGYPVGSYSVITNDGYILGMFNYVYFYQVIS